MLSALFGIKPAQFSDPNTARAMVIIVNTWAVLHDDPVYGACWRFRMTCAKPPQWTAPVRFRISLRITLPLLIKPLTPLMIASFAFSTATLSDSTVDQRRARPSRHPPRLPVIPICSSALLPYRSTGGGGQDFGHSGGHCPAESCW